MFTLSELKEEFSFIRNSSILNVPGVVVFDSGISGPCLGVTIQTHGNEPSGLAALRHFRKENTTRNLLKGSVVFVLNNIRAAEQYFKAMDISDPHENDAQKLAARFCDVNMNRLPTNTLELSEDSRYEILRAQELRTVWKRFDVGLDIHTTKTTIDPMIIAIGDVKSELYRGFPIDIVIRNIENVQTGKPACAFYGQPGSTPVVGIEAGLHEESASFDMAVTLVNRLLHNMGMLPSSEEPQRRVYKEYFINGSVFFPDESYELVRKFTPFEFLGPEQVIAEGDGNQIKLSFSCHTIFPPPGRKSTSPLSEEVMFLSSPVKVVEV